MMLNHNFTNILNAIMICFSSFVILEIKKYITLRKFKSDNNKNNDNGNNKDI